MQRYHADIVSFHPEGGWCSYADAQAELTEKKNELSDAWCTAFNLWPGDKDYFDGSLNEAIEELSRRLKAEGEAKDREIAALKKAAIDAAVKEYGESFRAWLAGNQNRDIAALREKLRERDREIERLREACKKALPRMAHRSGCASVVSLKQWTEQGGIGFDNCTCEIKDIKAALSQPDPETLRQIKECDT